MAPPVEELPVWPPGDPGRVLLHLDIKGASVDAVFADLFGNNSEFQVKLHSVRGDTNCVESPWFSSRNELPPQQYVWEGPAAGTDLGAPAPGKFRKVRFEAPPPPLASRGFQSEEVQKVLEASPGSHYLVETEVLTNAMYGDKFTIMCRYTIVARGPSDCELHLVYVINFVPSMTRMIKPIVTKGVDGGIRGTFNHVRRILGAQYTVEDLKEGHPVPSTSTANGTADVALTQAAPSAPAAPLPAAGPVLMPPAQPAALFGLADYLVYQELVAKVVALPDTVLIAKGLAIALTLAILHAAITLLRPLQATCGNAGGWLGAMCWSLVNVLDFPDSLTELLSGLLLVAVANRLLAFGTEMASDYLKESARQAQRAHAMQQAAATAAAAAAQAQQAAATADGDGAPPAAAPDAGPSMARLEIAAADDGRKTSPVKGMSAFLHQSFTTSKSQPAAASGLSVSAQSGTGTADATSPPLARSSAPASAPNSRGPSPVPQKAAASASPTMPSPMQTSSPVLGAPADEVDKAQLGNVVGKMFGGTNAINSSWSAMNTWSKSLLAANNEVVDSVSSSSENFKSFVTGAWQRTQESAKNLILTEAGGSVPLPENGSVASSPRSRARSNSDGGSGPAAIGRHGHTPSFTTTLDAGGFSIIEDYAQLDTPTLPHLTEEASLAAEESVVGSVSAAASAAPTPRPQRAVTPVEGGGAGGALPALSVAASDSEGRSETGVDEVEEEVFEHERVQPFRGWGHSWPGHFLPSDRVGHWGDRKGLPGGANAASFELVAPRTREGWEWRDVEWRIDYTGLEQEAVDKDGWSYGMDFAWMAWPAPPGSGKATIKTFVRRRRWLRVRVRSPEGGGGGMQLRPMSRASQERASRGHEQGAADAGTAVQQEEQVQDVGMQQDELLRGEEVLEDDEPLLPLDDVAAVAAAATAPGLPVTGVDTVDGWQQQQQQQQGARQQKDVQPLQQSTQAGQAQPKQEQPVAEHAALSVQHSKGAERTVQSKAPALDAPTAHSQQPSQPTAAAVPSSAVTNAAPVAAVDTPALALDPAAAVAPVPPPTAASEHSLSPSLRAAKLVPADLDPLSQSASSSLRAAHSPKAAHSPRARAVADSTGLTADTTALASAPAPAAAAPPATAARAAPAVAADAPVAASGPGASSSADGAQARQQRPMRLRSTSQGGGGSSGGSSTAEAGLLRGAVSPTTSIGSASGKSPRSSGGGAAGSPLSGGVSPRQLGSARGQLLQQASFGAGGVGSSTGGGPAVRPVARTSSTAGASSALRRTGTGTGAPLQREEGSRHLDDWAEW